MQTALVVCVLWCCLFVVPQNILAGEVIVGTDSGAVMNGESVPNTDNVDITSIRNINTVRLTLRPQFPRDPEQYTGSTIILLDGTEPRGEGSIGMAFDNDAARGGLIAMSDGMGTVPVTPLILGLDKNNVIYEGVRLDPHSNGMVLFLGGARLLTGANAKDIVIPNNAALKSENAALTATRYLIRRNANNHTEIGDNEDNSEIYLFSRSVGGGRKVVLGLPDSAGPGLRCLATPN